MRLSRLSSSIVYVAAVAVLLVSSLLLSIGSASLADAKKYKYSSSSNSAKNSNDTNSNGVITKLTLASKSQGAGDPNLTTEQAILGCQASSNPTAPPALKPWCDKFMIFLADYCLKHMTDPGAKESFQVCYDNDLKKDMIGYLYKYNMVVDGKQPFEVMLEFADNNLLNNE